LQTVGVDLIEVERIETMIARYGDRFLTRVFTARELQYCRGQVQSLAARFAAKEAVSKALGTGLNGLAWREIEIVSDARGKPSVQLSGQAAQRAAQMQIKNFALSLSHTRAHAIAFVVAE
jgi:holo-[acyl-carrier protein] synthase